MVPYLDIHRRLHNQPLGEAGPPGSSIIVLASSHSPSMLSFKLMLSVLPFLVSVGDAAPSQEEAVDWKLQYGWDGTSISAHDLDPSNPASVLLLILSCAHDYSNRSSALSPPLREAFTSAQMLTSLAIVWV